MNSNSFGRNLRRASALAVALASAATGLAQFFPSPIQWDSGSDKQNWISFSVANFSVDGSKASFQRETQHADRVLIGIDALRYRDTKGDYTLAVDGRGLAGDDEFRLRVRYTNDATGSWIEGGARSSRVFYEGSGGYLPTNGQWLETFDPDLAIDRGEYWLEGELKTGKTTLHARYSHMYRNGQKDSTSWADTNLTGLTGSTAARYIVPSFWDIDETRDTVAADATYQMDDNTKVGGGVRWENTETNNSRNVERRPTESADRFLTHRDQTDSDLFSIHGFTEVRNGEKLIMTAVASHTRIDTNFSGNRIYGASYDAVFDPTFSRRQARDEGFIGLMGDSQWKQTLLTANALYLPNKAWRINGGLRYEKQTQDVVSEFGETAVGTGAGLPTAVDELEGDSSRDFDDIMGSAEATYTGLANTVVSFFAEIADGNGKLREDLMEVETGDVDIGRDTTFDRKSTKYGVNARWYPAAHLNFAGGVYRKVRDNDYGTEDDSTPNIGTGDRYPAYILWQRFSTDDLNVRGTWRPMPGFSVVGRYDYQKTDVDSREDGLVGVQSSEMTSHILAGTVNWMPVNAVVVQGSLNYVYDEIITPAAYSIQDLARAVGRFDNNYRTASLLVIVAVDEKTDVQLDGSLVQADNYRDFTTVTMPYGLSSRDRSYGIAVTRRIDENMQVNIRYARVEYDNATAGGNRDFTADMIYGRLQLRY